MPRDPTFGDTTTETHNNIINAAKQSGSDLGAQVSNAISALKSNRGTVYIPTTDDGGPRTWSTDVTITPPNDTGVELQFPPGLEIEYTGSGFPITLEEAGWGGRMPAVYISGGRFYATGSDPAGCIRLNDSRNCFINPRHVSGFTNTTNDSQAIVYRNVDSFCERNFSGWVKFSDCDICYDTEPASVTGGADGGPSFVDNMWFWPSMQYNQIGMRLRGSHPGNVVDQPAFFPQTDNAVGVNADGAIEQMAFREPRFDDPKDSFTGTTAWETGSSYQQGLYIRNDRYHNIDTVLTKNSSGHRLLIDRTINDANGTRLERGELGGVRLVIKGNGDVELWDSSDTVMWTLNNSGQLATVPGTAVNGAGDYAIAGGDFYAKDDGGGLKVDTPDGTSTYRIRVDNNGNVVTDAI